MRMSTQNIACSQRQMRTSLLVYLTDEHTVNWPAARRRQLTWLRPPPAWRRGSNSVLKTDYQAKGVNAYQVIKNSNGEDFFFLFFFLFSIDLMKNKSVFWELWLRHATWRPLSFSVMTVWVIHVLSARCVWRSGSTVFGDVERKISVVMTKAHFRLYQAASQQQWAG